MTMTQLPAGRRGGLAAKLARWVFAPVLVGALVIFTGSKTDWPTWFVCALGGTLVAVLGWWIARRQGGLLGPHFFFDLIRLARRSRTRDLRVLYGLVLLV